MAAEAEQHDFPRGQIYEALPGRSAPACGTLVADIVLKQMQAVFLDPIARGVYPHLTCIALYHIRLFLLPSTRRNCWKVPETLGEEEVKEGGKGYQITKSHYRLDDTRACPSSFQMTLHTGQSSFF